MMVIIARATVMLIICRALCSWFHLSPLILTKTLWREFVILLLRELRLIKKINNFSSSPEFKSLSCIFVEGEKLARNVNPFSHFHRGVHMFSVLPPPCSAYQLTRCRNWRGKTSTHSCVFMERLGEWRSFPKEQTPETQAWTCLRSRPEREEQRAYCRERLDANPADRAGRWGGQGNRQVWMSVVLLLWWVTTSLVL